MDLIALLKDKNIIDADLASRATTSAATNNSSYEKVLLDEGVDSSAVRDAIGEYYGLPTATILATDKFDPKVLSYIPEESAEHYHAIPLRVTEGVLEVGVLDPENLSLKDALNFITNKHNLPYRLFVILEKDFEIGFLSYENITGDVHAALGAFESEEVTDASDKNKKEGGGEGGEDGEDGEDGEGYIKEDAPVTKIVATILRYAVDGKASDIHIEPAGERIKVRFRVDGTLMTSLELPGKVKNAVVARCKILASLRLDEKRKPQDGRFSAEIDGRKIDFRVSILPTNHGEKVVMRILDTEKGVRTLEGTGVSKYNVNLIRKAIQQPFGIILISGPTGSGKSTTLYSMLSEVDRIGKNVLSLEDPVEYDIDGVSQSQVRPEIGYTFANGLRTALRQDPDVILVGEIRDKETAQLAIQAALTGHLVLSTIHTNNALGVVPRLMDMGVDPYLIAPTLQLAIAQRLVRKICPGTGKKMPIEGSVKMMVDHEFESLPDEFRDVIPDSDYFLLTNPTPECASGTKGRVAVMEAVEMDADIEQLILQGGSEKKIYDIVRKKGFISMKEDAIIKALNHEIPFEEVNKLGGALILSDEAENETASATGSDAGDTSIEAPDSVSVDNQEISAL